MNKHDYRRGYLAGVKRAQRGHPTAGPIRPRRMVSDPEAYELGYHRGLNAGRRKECGECGTELLAAVPDGLCGFCRVETEMAA